MKKSIVVSLILLSGMLNFCSVNDMAINKKDLDFNVKPGDDFYMFANGGWIQNNPLPNEYSRYGRFDRLAEDNQKIVRSLIENAAQSTENQSEISKSVGDLFNSGMDTARINESGYKPLAVDLDLIKNAGNINEIQKILFDYHAKGNSMLYFIFGAPDRKNSQMMIANLYQGGLGLTDVDYYTAKDDKTLKIQKEYKKYISDMFVLVGEDDTEAKAETIYNIENRLAESSMTRLERRNPYATYNKLKIEELQALSPGIDWTEYFRNCGLDFIEEVNVSQPEFFAELSRMFNEIPLEEWKLYMKWHLINNSSPYLSSDFLNRNFEFYGKFLSGKKALQPTWKRVLNVVDFALGEAVGQMFVEKYFPPEAKERMLSLVGNLKTALSERIDNLEWMSDETKLQAQKKLTAMNVKIGYPDKWRDYSELTISSDSYFENIQKAGRFNFQYRISKIGKEVDPDEWGMYPQTVNAYYNPSRNEIVFPAGILQPPFFYMDADDAVNYGAIGMVIGHEMTHGFDDQGRQYDLNGNLVDWWTEEDSERFKKRAEVIINQFDNYYVTDSVKANGKLTLGENIADLGGLNIAYTAVQKAWQENEPDNKINGFTPEQRFFLAFAQIWGANITHEEILKRTKEDVHSLGNLRVNGPLPNMEEFYQAFNIGTGSKLFIAEDERASIW